ncbi:hypothetical protein SASPL_138668 [Salvia splendens]|uniref:C3H1-type domain-containing protein n=2 Tax=Salvia splendens TaxID=180675 RepID=A0A8X8ZE43_SALSN|nr:uncharacterized protein LOC121763276 isoform X2 [Salvia splendens]XP_042015199.1 uncharacterized protein LOC121763276 isoform X2 [Salvia splendens]XP_042015200.1 uncharacterized protein LOC121763276 isoform X2 [Salvia splendens]KAG6401802.1 hypothetical protein SASPL_138668 [Salvia splendens]
MHGQGNYDTPAGQDPYGRQPAFQQHPATTALPTSHYGPLPLPPPPPPQPQIIQHGHPSFHPRPGAVAYQHAMTNVLHHGRPAPVMSGGMSAAQSYGHHPRPPHISSQVSHSYPSNEQQPTPWNQNIHQRPPPPPPPSLQGQGGYQLPSSQAHTLERGHPSHAPPPPPPCYPSSSNVLTSDPCGSSVIPMREHSYQQPIAPVLTPPPPPPPPLPPSPPRVPPIPPSSDTISKKEGNHSWKGLPDSENLKLECSPPGKPMDDRSIHEQAQFQHTESGLKVGAEAAHSPTDSDMDMEDDITYPDEEKKNCSYVNSNDEIGSMPLEDYTTEKLQALHQTGGHRLPAISVCGNVLPSEVTEVSIAHAKEGGSEVAFNYNFPVTMKVFPRAESVKTENGQNEISLDASINVSPSVDKYSGQSGGSVVHPEPGYGVLPGQLVKCSNPSKILQGYSPNSNSANEEENLGDVSFPSTSDATTKYDAKQHAVGSEDIRKSLSESNKYLLSESVTGSPRNGTQSDKLDVQTGVVAEFSDRGQKPVSSDGTYTARQSKDHSAYCDENVGLEEANAHKENMKTDKPKVDEFGRLIREDVSDSDMSDSPRHMRRHERRTRKRSPSQSRSRSPHDRRRRRSPWRRKERRGRSRSLSPRRRNRSQSPVLRHDKIRKKKDQLPECFDFLQGKCYRGAACRYSHHASDKGERSRYNRGKHRNWDTPPTLVSPDFHEESNVLSEKQMNDKGRKLSQDMPDLWEVKDAKRLPVDSTTQSPDKIWNLLGYPSHDTFSGKHNYLIPESATKYSDKIPQIVDQQGERTDDSFPPDSSLAQLLAGAPTHHPADGQDPTSQRCYAESHLAKLYSNQEVPSRSLNPPIANHPSRLPIPVPSTSQPVSASFAPPILQNYNSDPPTSQNHLTPENYSSYEAPVNYQHSHFPGPLKPVSSLLLPPPPPPLLRPPVSVEHTTFSQHAQQSLLPPWNGLYSYSSVRNQQTEMPNRPQIGEYQASCFSQEPDQMLHRTDGSGSNSLHVSNQTSGEGAPCMMSEGHIPGDLAQGINSSKSFTQALTNPSLRQSPFKGFQSSLGAGLSSESNSSHCHPYFQQASYGMQYSAGGDAIFSEPGMRSSSASRITQDFLERNRSYVHGFVGSKITNHFNPYASTFDLPLSSKLSSSSFARENDAATDTTYGTPGDPHRIQNAGSKNVISLSSVLPPECVSRPTSNQYDPLFDSIEQNSKSFCEADHLKHEITGDSDDVLRFHGSRRLENMGAIKQEVETAVSADDSLEKEECGETADLAVVPVPNSSPSNPNEAPDMDVGEFEIDQVKTSGKNKKSKEKSSKHFKISIAAFVKDVLKPSWRQGNMSKEAFKTIVKKTVDKVSGAMKSHQVPKSQAKINHYIDSSRGKLTKLVMGYVDKYVKA